MVDLDKEPLIKEDPINLRAILTKYTSNWYWFLLSVLLCVSIAFLYLRYVTPAYKITYTLLIKDDKRAPDQGGEAAAFADLDIFKGNQNLSNEIEVLKGKTLMQRVVSRLNLQTSYFSEGAIKTTELYGAALPIHFIISKLDSSVYQQSPEIFVEAKDHTHFILHEEAYEQVFAFGEAIQRPYSTFTVIRNRPFTDGRKIKVVLNNEKQLAGQFSRNLTIAPVNDDASVISLSLISTTPGKAADVINALVKTYNQENLEDKNQLAANTVKFIDERLSYLVNELSTVEQHVEQYKKQNEITSVSDEAHLYLEEAGEYNRRLAEYETKISVLQSIRDYLRQSNNKNELVPSTLGIDDPTLLGLIGQFNALQLEKQRLLRTAQPNNPLVVSAEEQLAHLRANMLENLENIKSGLEITKKNLQENTGRFRSRIQEVPSIERNLLEIQRQQGIKETLYAYLLQKREEAAISLASNVSNSRTIDPALVGNQPVKPKRQSVYLLALALGLVLPFGSIYMKDLFNDKVQSQSDLKGITEVPILGELNHDSTNQALVVSRSGRSSIEELFRLIRSNLTFTMPGKGQKKILVTSSMSGEGKTFFTINLGATLALAGKKVAILEFDIRRPKMLQDLNLAPKAKGITNYLVDEHVKLADISQPLSQMEGLMVIGAGPIPPNPAELLLNPRVKQLFKELEADYDIILIDSSPVGQVADAFTLGQHADTCAYIVRYNYTFKEQLNIVKDITENKKLHNVLLVMNDAKKENSYGYGYGYGYGESEVDKSSRRFGRLGRYIKRNL